MAKGGYRAGDLLLPGQSLYAIRSLFVGRGYSIIQSFYH